LKSTFSKRIGIEPPFCVRLATIDLAKGNINLTASLVRISSSKFILLRSLKKPK
jgi:hypothetical protein